jgi:threonine synthase
VGFQEVVLMGLADDGGLMIPDAIPDVRAQLDAWEGLSYAELALEVLRPFVADIPEADLLAMVAASYARDVFEPEVAPTVRVGPVHVLELWHGPTLAFKDVALQLLGRLFEYILARRGGRLNILGATSGDTGSAAICGVRGRRGIEIFMLHPHGRISPIQRRQMTTVPDANVHNLALEGTFDDCQAIMKSLAGDLDFKRAYAIGAVNSVNWARVLAQIVYYFRAALDVRRTTGCRRVQFAVPTGNFGDVLAGWYALKMGAPISRLILATNENDILCRFFSGGTYSRGDVLRTLSPSMDIQVASNFERYLYYKVGADADRLCGLMEQFARTGSLHVEPAPDGAVDRDFLAGKADQDQCLRTIRKYHQEHGYLLDPHTAVGVAVAEQVGLAGDPVICLATAHPAKFPDAIRQATGKDLAHHPKIDKLMELPARCIVVPNDKEKVRQFIIDTIG